MKRTPLKRRPPKRRPNYARFWREVTADGSAGCALAGERIPCFGVLDAHHFVPKRRLRTDAAKTDSRNGVPLCRSHHDLVEQGVLAAPRPPELPYFLADHAVPDRSVPAGKQVEAEPSPPVDL